MYTYIYIYIYIYISYIYIHISLSLYIYIYICRKREIEREGEREREIVCDAPDCRVAAAPKSLRCLFCAATFVAFRLLFVSALPPFALLPNGISYDDRFYSSE